jgi:hypothetical protein
MHTRVRSAEKTGTEFSSVGIEYKGITHGQRMLGLSPPYEAPFELEMFKMIKAFTVSCSLPNYARLSPRVHICVNSSALSDRYGMKM